MNGFEPFQIPEPAQSKVVRIPFTAMINGGQIYGLTSELLQHSPFVRLEKVIRYKPVAFMYCGGELDCLQPGGMSIQVTDVFSRAVTDSWTNQTGFSVSSEAGFSLKGFSAKVTTTWSWSHSVTHGVTRTQTEGNTVSYNKPCPANHACAAWTGRLVLVVNRRASDGTLLRLAAGELAFDLGDPIYFDDWP